MSREYFVSGSQVNETTNSQFLADSLFQLNAAAAFNGSGSGSIDTVSLTAVSGTASFSNSSSGSVDTVSLTAPDASTSTGDTGIGDIDAVDLLAPNGTASFDNSSAVSIDTLSLSAPTATTNSDVSASGSIDEIILGEQDGTASFTSEASASIDTISLIAPDAVGSSGDTGVGSIDLIDLTTISATTSYSSSVSGSIDTISLSAPTGNGASDSSATGTGSIDAINLLSCAGNSSISNLTVNEFPAFPFGTGSTTREPCGVAIGNRLYITSKSENLIYVIDSTDKNSMSVINTVSAAGNPLVIVTDGTSLFVVFFGSNTLKKYNLTDPDLPALDLSVSIGAQPRTLAVDGDYVYVCNDSVANFIIYNKADLTTVSTTTTTTHPTSPVIIGGNTLYIMCGSTSVNTLEIWDVTNKASPSLLGSASFGNDTRSIAIEGNYLYTASIGKDIVVADISNPSAVSIVYSHTVAGIQVYSGVHIVDSYFFGNDSDGVIYWYDISNPLSPVFVGSDTVGFTTTYLTFQGGSYFYIPSSAFGAQQVVPVLFEISSSVSVSGDIDAIELSPPYALFVDGDIDSIILGELQATASTDAGVGIGYIDSISIGELTAVASPVFDISPTVISQYANSPIILSLVTDMMIYLNANHQRNEFIRNIWDVRTANSQGLDIWGRIVGISRYLTLTNQDYFGFDPDFDPFNNSPFFAGNNVTNTFILSDEDYRRVILAKASANITNCTIPGIENTLSLLFGERGAIWVDVTGDHELTYVFNFVPTELELAIINAPKLIPRPAGFTIIYDYLT